MLSWAPIPWKGSAPPSTRSLSVCLMGWKYHPSAACFVSIGSLELDKSTPVCWEDPLASWAPITWKETPLLYYLGHFSLIGLSIHLGVPHIVILVTRTLSFFLPPFSLSPHVLNSLLELSYLHLRAACSAFVPPIGSLESCNSTAPVYPYESLQDWNPPLGGVPIS